MEMPCIILKGAEDLAALHASMLRAAKHSEAAAAEGNERAIRARRQSGRITVGDKVDARFGGGTSFFPAVVTKVRQGCSCFRCFLDYKVSLIAFFAGL